jgi:hypothetical protein
MSLRFLIPTLALAALTLSPLRAEIVERELGTDAAGNPIVGPVLQGGRDFRRSTRVSGLSARRAERPRRGYQRPAYGYGLPWWYVPVIPMHCGGHGPGGSFTLWHGWGDQVSVTIIR